MRRFKHYLVLLSLFLFMLPIVAQQTPGYIVDAAVTAVNIAIPDKGDPIGWTHTTLPATNNSSLGCILVEGTTLSREVIPYVVRLEYPDGIYNVHVSDTGEIVQLCDTKFPAESLTQQPTATPTDLPEGVPSPTPSGDLCTITPRGTFANLRSEPGTDSDLIKILYPYETFVVLGRSGDWYFSERGWANFDVVEFGGNCDNLSALSAAQAAEASIYVCPPNFFEHLEPRITRGQVTAQVIQGSLPNRLREEPTIDSEMIGEIQPGRRIDEVLSGPACSGGYVWWEVNIDGTVGWTAESDFESGEYFLEPVSEEGVTIVAEDTTEPIDQPMPQAAPGDASATTPTGAVMTSANAPQIAILETLPVDGALSVVWSPDGSQLAVDTPQGVIVFNYPDTSQFEVVVEGRKNDLGNVMAYSSDGRYLAVGGGDGSIVIYDFSTNVATALPGIEAAPIATLAFRPEINELISVSGSTQDGENWALKRWDMQGIDANIGDTPITLNYSFPFPLTDVAFSEDGDLLAVTGESTLNPAAALWAYDADNGDLLYSIGLQPMQGFTFVAPVPENAGMSGDFLVGNGGAVTTVTVATQEVTAFYQSQGYLVTEVTTNTEDGATLLSIANAAPGAPNGTETVSFFASDNLLSPATTINLMALDISFNPDGTRLAVVSFEGKVLLLGVAG